MSTDRSRDPTVASSGHPAGSPVALLLPGMTLNETIFPDLGIPTVVGDFTRLVVGPVGWSEALARGRMDYYAALLSERLQTEPAWTQASRRLVVGHSFGGMLALAWLIKSAGHSLERIDGLVLVGTTAGPMLGGARLRLGALAGREIRLPTAPLMGIWDIPAVTRGMSWLLGWGGSGKVDFRTLWNRSDLAVGVAGWRNTDWRARRSYRAAMDGFDVRDRLPAIGVPVIVLHGTRDIFFPLDSARALAAALPRAELRVVPGAAHVLPLTHPEAVATAVRDLLAF